MGLDSKLEKTTKAANHNCFETQGLVWFGSVGKYDIIIVKSYNTVFLNVLFLFKIVFLSLKLIKLLLSAKNQILTL